MVRRNAATVSAIGMFVAVSLLIAAGRGIAQAADAPPKVDFSYSFAAPHRITIARPDASDKTLLDVQPGWLRMAWTYDSLAMPNYPPLALKTPSTQWDMHITPRIDGKQLVKSRWTRLDGALPALENVYEDAPGSVRLEALGGVAAALIRVSVSDTDSKPHQFVLACDSVSWWGENQAWMDATQFAGDYMVAGFTDRADRVLVLGLGADAYSLRDDNVPPGRGNLIMVWNLKPGEKRQGWLVRPYRAYAADLPELRKHDWTKEMEQCRKEWHDLLGRASKLSIPDVGVTNGYQACLADLFVMREPTANGCIIATPGTEGYRAGNACEPLIIVVALDQNGLHKEAFAELPVAVEMQEPNGNWADNRGWSHAGWCIPGFKSWAIMEHYRLTGDKQFLADVYPRMVASSRWQEGQRARSRKASGERPLTYGLMPRGQGDGGLTNDGDWFGVFYPHNIWSVYADRCSLEAAEILGKTNDAVELKKIFETARNDLFASMERGCIKEKDYRWIPGTPGKTAGSRWAVLNIASPCRLLPPEHELVAGTLRKIESNMSKGGQPLHTGWMEDGAWVGITLDNVAEMHLARGNGDAAAKYFYSSLNHGTPLYTWCEERGQDPGSSKTSGDRQHLWTPVAVVRCLRDMMVMDRADGLDLALGTDRSWLASGKTVGIANACTHFGTISYQMQYDLKGSKVTGEVLFPGNSTAASSVLHIRLPGGLKVKSVNPESKAAVSPDGSGIRWNAPHGTMKFEAIVGK